MSDVSIFRINHDSLRDIQTLPQWVVDAVFSNFINERSYRFFPDQSMANSLNEYYQLVFGKPLQTLITVNEIQTALKRARTLEQEQPKLELNSEQTRYLYQTLVPLDEEVDTKQKPRSLLLRRQQVTSDEFNQTVLSDVGLFSECNVWIIIARYRGMPYGAVYLFQNRSQPDVMMFQGINKFDLPWILSLVRPSETKQLPKLNDLLIPAIEQFAKENDVKKLLVQPLSYQGQLLEKHYPQFKKITTAKGLKQEPICKLILRGFVNYPFYESIIEHETNSADSSYSSSSLED